MSQYAKNLQKSDKEKASEVVNHQESQAKAVVASAKASLEGQLSKARQSVEAQKSVFPFDIQAVINANNQIKEIQDSLDSVAAIEKELFS